MKMIIVTLASATALIVPVAAEAQGNPLSAIFQCNNPNNRQSAGAVVGGLLGGVLGNQIAGDNKTLGTILGAAAGAAVGSSIGCNLNTGGGDATQAEQATRLALEQNRSQTWSNARTGDSGRVDIISSFNRDAQQASPYYGAPSQLDQIRFAGGVQRPTDYVPISDTFRVNSNVNLRAGPDARSRVLNQLRSGGEFQALARLNNGWLLVGENGLATGYVAERAVQLVSRGGGYERGYSANAAGTYDEGYNDGYADGLAVARGGVASRSRSYAQRAPSSQLCRTFDQTVQQRDGYNRVTERFTACQAPDGQWAVL